jgi:hypothetical protein
MPLPPTVALGELCPLCGAPLHPEQDWCLNCGAAARTRLAAAPNWKAPLAILAAVIALSLGVLAAALVALAGGSGAAPTTTTTVTTPVAASPTPTTGAPATTAPAATTPNTTTAGVGLPGGATAPTLTGASTATTPALSAPTGTPGAKPRHLSPALERLLGKFRRRASK